MMRRLLHRSRFRRRGMTLVEVMVALAVLVIMSVVSWDVLRSAIEINDLLARGDETARSARVALSKIKRELQLAYLTPNKGAIETYETVFVGLDDNPDSIYFATLAHQRVYANSRECDQAEVTIWTDSSPSEKGTGYVLYHRESPRIDEEPAQQGKVYPLAYNVRSFELKYMDQNKEDWVDEWDTRSVDTLYRLPRAVQVGLVLIGPDLIDPEDTRDVPFFTTVILEYAKPMPKSLFSDGGGAGDEGVDPNSVEGF